MGINTDEAKGRHIREAYNFNEVYEGEVANTVAALTDDLYVFIENDPDQDDPNLRHRDGPVLGWDKRMDGTLPQKGNKCSVARGNNGNLWMIAWWPYG